MSLKQEVQAMIGPNMYEGTPGGNNPHLYIIIDTKGDRYVDPDHTFSGQVSAYLTPEHVAKTAFIGVACPELKLAKEMRFEPFAPNGDLQTVGLDFNVLPYSGHSSPKTLASDGANLVRDLKIHNII